MLPQQAAERALKAVLAARTIDFPRTHALDRLVLLLDDTDAEHFDHGQLVALSPWAVAGRYPEDIPSPTSETTRELITAAATVLKQATALITPPQT